ncbi:MAG: alpha/beta hydrolase [Elusimicrobiales bacterium]|nr:alpha/beta hydrolase [Elusimicrobiales bacterium]
MRGKRALMLAAAMGLGGCTHLFFQPSRHIHSDPAELGYRYEAIKFESLDGTPLTGLFFPPEGAPKATVVHFHGNAQNMTSHYPYSAWLAREGYNVFIFDYRGYGASGGKPSLDGVVMDGKAALAHALKLPGASPERMIVFGQSLGGAVAVAAAAESGLNPAALILEGTFHSYRGVGAAVLRRGWLTWPVAWTTYLAIEGGHAPGDNIGKIDCPKIFIHSEKDPTVPYAQGRKLFDAAPEPKVLWKPPSGHVDAFGAHGGTFRPLLLEFLNSPGSDPLPPPR